MAKDNRAVFQLENVSFSHGDKKILERINLTIEQGKIYGLVGPNGSGKTTLLDLLSRGLQPQTGTIEFHGQSLANYSSIQLSRQLAYVPQEFHLGFDFSVLNVVLMGRHPYIPRFANPTKNDLNLVEQALELMDIVHLKNRLVTELSGGEKQRVIVARALAQNTDVLILDEATSNLDIQHTIRIMKVIRDKTRTHHLTAVTAIHDLNLAAGFCDEIIVLKDKTIFKQGNVTDIISQQLLRHVFSVEADVVNDPAQTTPRIFFDLQ